MREPWAIDSLHVGVQCDPTLASKVHCMAHAAELWPRVDKFVCGPHIRPHPCLGVDQCARSIGFVGGGLFGIAFDVASRKKLTSLGAGVLGAAIDAAEQCIGKRLFFPHTSKLGTRAIHSFSWTDSMDRVALALCFVNVFDARLVFHPTH